MNKQFKKEIIKNFFYKLEQRNIENFNVFTIFEFIKKYNECVKNCFKNFNYMEQKNIFKSISIIMNKDIENKFNNLKDILITIIQIIKYFDNKDFNNYIIKNIDFNNYYIDYFSVIYPLYKLNLIDLNLEQYIDLFNNKYSSYSDRIKEEFFILFIEKIAIEYNKDKKIGYTRIHWNDIFNRDFKLKFLLSLINIWNKSSRQEDIMNILLLLDNFIYIYIDVFSELLNKIQFYNIKFNIDYRIELNQLLNKNSEIFNIFSKNEIEEILKDNNVNININYYIVLFLLNLFTYKIKTDKDYKEFQKEIYLNNIDLNILKNKITKNLPLIIYSSNYELIYLINLGVENKFINIKENIDRFVYLLEINKNCKLYTLKNNKIKEELPEDFEWWKNQQLLKKLEFLFYNYKDYITLSIEQQNYYLNKFKDNLNNK